MLLFANTALIFSYARYLRSQWLIHPNITERVAI